MAQIPSLNFKDFSGGLRLPAPDARDYPLDTMSEAKGVFVLPFGGFELRTGIRDIVRDLAGPVQGFTRYRTSIIQRLVYALAGDVISRNEADGTEVVLDTTGSATNNFQFASFTTASGERLFWVDGTNFIKSWDGVTLAATGVGIDPPGFAPSLSSGGAGVLNSTNLDPYQYYTTFGTAAGIESNPSPISQPLAVNLEKIDLLTIATSTDARVTKRHLYRVGGNLSTAVRVATINNNTSAFYQDNLADAVAGNIQVSFSRDVPLAGAHLIKVWKSRLWVVNRFRVWYSSLGYPDYFPTTITDRLIDGNYFDVDPDPDNPITEIGESGSVLIIKRRKNIYGISGDYYDNLTFFKIADLGGPSSRDLVLVGNEALYAGVDGMLYTTGSDTPLPVALPLLPALVGTADTPGLTDDAIKRATACYHRQRYIVCFPDTTDINKTRVFAYDTRVGEAGNSGVWTELSDPQMAGTQYYAQRGLGDLDEMLFSTAPGYKDAAGVLTQGIFAALNRDDVSPVAFSVKSGDIEPGGVTGLWDVEIAGNLTTGAAGVVTLTLSSEHIAPDGSKSVYTRAYNVPSGNGILLKTRVSEILKGQRHSWKLSGTAEALTVIEVRLGVAGMRAEEGS